MASVLILLEYDAAIVAAREVIYLLPDYPLPYRWLAAALGQLGQIAEARQTLEKAIAVAPASWPSRAHAAGRFVRPAVDAAGAPNTSSRCRFLHQPGRQNLIGHGAGGVLLGPPHSPHSPRNHHMRT